MKWKALLVKFVHSACRKLKCAFSFKRKEMYRQLSTWGKNKGDGSITVMTTWQIQIT